MTALQLQETRLGLSWERVSSDTFQGTIRLSTGSQLYAFCSQSILDGEPVWNWTVQLQVWDEIVQAHVRPTILLFSGSETARSGQAEEDVLAYISWIVSKMSASMLTMLEASVHEFDYERLCLAMPKSSRKSTLDLENLL